MNFPVAIFVYNRPEHLSSLLRSLMQCREIRDSDLYIFCDGCSPQHREEGVNACRAIVESLSFRDFKSLNRNYSTKNRGLARSIISGVSNILERHSAVIVLEDDLVVSRDFLRYMNLSLAKYQSNPRVGSVAGFSFPIRKKSSDEENLNFFHPRASTWGWGTWADRWIQVDWECEYFQDYSEPDLKHLMNDGGEDLYRMLHAQQRGHINSWGIRWAAHHLKNQLLVSYPFDSKVKNGGYGKNATHTKTLDPYLVSAKESDYLRQMLADSTIVDPYYDRQIRWYNSNLYKILFKLRFIAVLRFLCRLMRV